MKHLEIRLVGRKIVDVATECSNRLDRQVALHTPEGVVSQFPDAETEPKPAFLAAQKIQTPDINVLHPQFSVLSEQLRQNPPS